MGQSSTIVLEGVSVRYGQTRALQSVDVTFVGGEVVALIGPNGSGKTTLLRLLAGLQRPSEGHIERPRRSVAYVSQLQQHHQWMPLTVGEVIRTGRYGHRGLLRRFRPDDVALCATAADRLEVEDLWHQRFTDLSGGQQQRVVIARALAAEANVLLLDEPITGLDLVSQQIILDVMAEAREQGALVVFSTHHLEEARICDRVLLVRQQILADGPPATVLTSERLTELFGSHAVRAPGDTVLVIDDHSHHHHPHDETGVTP